MKNFYSTVLQLEHLETIVLFKLRKDFSFFVQLREEANNLESKPLEEGEELIQFLLISEFQSPPLAIIGDYTALAHNDFELVRHIRSLEAFIDLPILAIRDESDAFAPDQALVAGIDDCFAKPVSWEQLERAIQWQKHIRKTMPDSEEITEAKIAKIPFLKRLLDIIVAFLAIVLLSPLFLLIGLCIKLESKGPVIYRSKRAGTGYQVFNFLKFRSMYKDADQRIKELEHLNQYQTDGAPCFVKFKNDPRITFIGRIIRKTSLDELPQLFNVLKGDMSLVGNRPLPLYEAEQLTRDEWVERFMAPAGITGLWQVTKRGKDNMSTRERVALDLTYAKKYSLWYDLKIIVKTFPAMLQHENV